MSSQDINPPRTQKSFRIKQQKRNQLTNGNPIQTVTTTGITDQMQSPTVTSSQHIHHTSKKQFPHNRKLSPSKKLREANQHREEIVEEPAHVVRKRSSSKTEYEGSESKSRKKIEIAAAQKRGSLIQIKQNESFNESEIERQTDNTPTPTEKDMQPKFSRGADINAQAYQSIKGKKAQAGTKEQSASKRNSSLNVNKQFRAKSAAKKGVLAKASNSSKPPPIESDAQRQKKQFPTEIIKQKHGSFTYQNNVQAPQNNTNNSSKAGSNYTKVASRTNQNQQSMKIMELNAKFPPQQQTSSNAGILRASKLGSSSQTKIGSNIPVEVAQPRQIYSNQNSALKKSNAYGAQITGPNKETSRSQNLVQQAGQAIMDQQNTTNLANGAANETFDIIRHNGGKGEQVLQASQMFISPTKQNENLKHPPQISNDTKTAAQEAANSVLKKAQASHKPQSPFEQFLSNLVVINNSYEKQQSNQTMLSQAQQQPQQALTSKMKANQAQSQSMSITSTTAASQLQSSHSYNRPTGAPASSMLQISRQNLENPAPIVHNIQPNKQNSTTSQGAPKYHLTMVSKDNIQSQFKDTGVSNTVSNAGGAIITQQMSYVHTSQNHNILGMQIHLNGQPQTVGQMQDKNKPMNVKQQLNKSGEEGTLQKEQTLAIGSSNLLQRGIHRNTSAMLNTVGSQKKIDQQLNTSIGGGTTGPTAMKQYGMAGSQVEEYAKRLTSTNTSMLQQIQNKKIPERSTFDHQHN